MVKLILGILLGATVTGMIRDAEASKVIPVFVEYHQNSQILSPPDL